MFGLNFLYGRKLTLTAFLSKLPQASAMAVIGWWTGYSLPGYLAFVNADSVGWNGVYYGMAVIVDSGRSMGVAPMRSAASHVLMMTPAMSWALARPSACHSG